MLLVVASSLLGELLRRRSDGGDEEGKAGDAYPAAGAAMDMCVECISAVIAAEPGSTVHRLAVAYLGPLVAYSPVALSRPFVQVRRRRQGGAGGPCNSLHRRRRRPRRRPRTCPSTRAAASSG